MVEDRMDKIFALKRLMEKYQPEGADMEISPQKNWPSTGIVRIDIDEMTGKQDI